MASDSGLETRDLTWTALLGQWLNFARASLALPPSAEGHRWRRSVVPIITLQAVTFALGDLDRLPPGDRPLALDKAEMLITGNIGELESIWADGPLPPLVREIGDDARSVLLAARG